MGEGEEEGEGEGEDERVTRGVLGDREALADCEGEDLAHSVLVFSPRERRVVVCQVPMILRVVVWLVGSLLVTWRAGSGECGERMYLLYTDFDTSGNFMMRDSVDIN